MSEEIIEYRGEQIDVGHIRENLSAFRKNNGTPWFTPEELEKEVQKRILLKKRYIGRLTGTRYEKNQGFRLEFYLREHQMFPQAFETKVNDHQAVLLVRKLFKHFGDSYRAKHVNVRFHGNRQSGNAGGWGGLRLSHNPNIGLICHEVAHYFHKKHDRKLMHLIKRMIHYCEKKGWVK